MSEKTILERIRRVAEQRQALWSKTTPLTTTERAAIVRLTGELEALWEQQRGDLARKRWAPARRSSKAAAPSRRRTAA